MIYPGSRTWCYSVRSAIILVIKLTGRLPLSAGRILLLAGFIQIDKQKSISSKYPRPLSLWLACDTRHNLCQGSFLNYIETNVSLDGSNIKWSICSHPKLMLNDTVWSPILQSRESSFFQLSVLFTCSRIVFALKVGPVAFWTCALHYFVWRTF